METLKTPSLSTNRTKFSQLAGSAVTIQTEGSLSILLRVESLSVSYTFSPEVLGVRSYATEHTGRTSCFCRQSPVENIQGAVIHFAQMKTATPDLRKSLHTAAKAPVMLDCYTPTFIHTSRRYHATITSVGFTALLFALRTC